MSPAMNSQPVTILVCALGGEGGGVLADWLVATARAAGHAVQATSIPGVAQRTGATTYYLEIAPQRATDGSPRPVFGLYAVPGALDLLVGTELMEVVRQAGLGMISPERTAVVASTSRTLTTLEKMQLGDGRTPESRLVEVLGQCARELELLDMAALARSTGSVVSAVLFGALAGFSHASGLLPFARADYEAAIRNGGKGVDASLRGFAAAWERVAGAKSQRDAVLQIAAGVLPEPAQRGATLAPEIAARFPAPMHAMLALGHARLVDYQGARYAELYLARLERLITAENGGHSAALEATRWLALWMAFDDIVRVAELKSRASRFERVRREAQAEPGSLLRVLDHFKPGVPEVAALLPARLATALERWDARRVARGREPFALPLKLPSHGVGGLIALRALAAMKRWRPSGSRYAIEQALIERWLGGIEAGLRRGAAPGLDHNLALGLEISRCGQLIKGYGSTNERGKRNLLHIIDHLHHADAVAAARRAALADEAGTQLDQALIAHGAPARTPVAQPIRWHRRRPHPPASGAVRPL